MSDDLLMAIEDGTELVVREEIVELVEVQAQGPAGPPGPTGDTGQGVPAGGTAGQPLVKIDGTNYNTAWSALAAFKSWLALTLSDIATALGFTPPPNGRNIATTAPLTGGGDLSANRTLAINDFVGSGASHARGAVPDPGANAGTTKFLREDGGWAVPPDTNSGGTVSSVSIAAPLAGISQSGSPVTGSGTITLALANDLSALESLTGTGYSKRTGVDAWALVTSVPSSDVSGLAAIATSGSANDLGDLTAYGRSLLALANAPALAAEVDPFFLTPAEGNAAYQPLDSDLTAIAALSTTSFGRSLLALADAAAGRTAFALGTAATADTGTGAANVPTITQADARYQPLDSDLTAIAALSTTAYGRSLLEAANAGAVRSLAGLVIGTDVQAQDAELSALAGLTSGANKLPYFTGSGTAALADLTAFIRTLLDDADAATARATMGAETAGAAAAAQAASQPLDSDLTAIAALTTTPYGRSLLEAASAAALRTLAGLVIGTDVQAQDAELAAIAGLTSAANKLPYFTGSGTAALADFTTAGRALVDDADAAAQRTTLGLGSIAPQEASNVTITGGSVTGITDLAVADGGTGASTAANARTNLGLVIGTDVQAQDAELSALAGLTSAADKVPYFTGSGTAAVATFTSAARALIAAANTAAQRVTLGVSPASTGSFFV